MARAERESPQHLLNQLVETALRQAVGSSHPVHLGLSAEDVARLRGRLRARLLNTLYGSLPGPLQHGPPPTPTGGRLSARTSGLGVKEKLLMIIFSLREKRKFDEAQQVESIVDRFSKLRDEENEQADIMERALVFLLALAGTGQFTVKPAVGHQMPKLPDVGIQQHKDDEILPGGNWFHGDGKHVFRCDKHQPFVNYSRELFECRGAGAVGSNDSGISEISSNDSLLNNKIFETEPGQDLRGNRLFAVKSLMGNAYERKTRESLFGGLVHSHVTGMKAKLSLPDLPDSTNPSFLGIKVPDIAESTLSNDEGYHESMSDSVLSVSDASSPGRENLWDAALRYQPSRHRTWENIGNHPRPTEKPYLTEAGAGALDLVYELRCKEVAIVQPASKTQLTTLRDQRRLVQHVWNVLIGLPSDLFILDEASASFSINTQVCLTGTTPESLQPLLAEFASAGTDHTRLCHVSRQPITDSAYSGGLVLQAFLGAVRRYLQYYHAQVLLAQSQFHGGGGEKGLPALTILTIRDMFSKLMAQLRYLAQLCGCDDRKGTKPGGRDDPLPIGIRLLSYLYQETLDSTGTGHYPLMLSLLRSACAPYLMFIQDWVFHGICRDTYGEFMIHANDSFLFYRDKYYWTHGYVLVTGENESAVPMFLQELSSDIYVCGKTINLLKLCTPEHFICNVMVETPHIGLTFSTAELDLVTSRTKTYIKHMEVLAGQLTVSRREKERREEAARVELLAVARRTAAEEQQKHNEILKERREAIGAKKRKEFLALKEQMKKDLLRRGQEAEDEKEEDRERLEEALRRELAVEETESELEKQAREEVIKMYSELAKQATLREQRALWRIRRRQLDQERIEFLRKEREALRQELEAPPPPAAPAAAPAISVTRIESKGGDGGRDQGDAVSLVQGGPGTSSDERRDDLGGGERAVAVDTASDAGRFDGTADAVSTKGALTPSDSETGVLAGIHPVVVETGTETEGRGDDDADDDSDHHDALDVGNVGNEDVDPVLALIRGDEKKGPGKKPERTKKKTKTVSVTDFLPREEVEGATAALDSDEERPRDTTVDDVLAEIGSSLPSQIAAADEETSPHGALVGGDVLADILGGNKQEEDGVRDGWIVGLPHREHKHGHPSQSTVLDPTAISQDDATSQKATSRGGHGHASDATLQVGLDPAQSTNTEASIGGAPLHGVPRRSHHHGQVGDSTIQTIGSAPVDQTEESSGLVGVPQRSHQHGHISATTIGSESSGAADLDYGSTEGLPHRPHVHGHPSQSSVQVGQSVDGSTTESTLPESNVHGHPSQSSIQVGQSIGESATESTLPKSNIHGHPSQSSIQVGHSVDESTPEGAPVRSVYGHASDSSLGKDAPIEDPSSKGLVGLPSRPHLHGHASDSTMTSVIAGTSDPKGDSLPLGAMPSQSLSSSSEGLPGVPHRPVLAPQTGERLADQEGGDQLLGVPHRAHLHGHAADSTLGNVMYPSQAGDGGDEKLAVQLMTQAHPSDSSVQKLLYPLQKAHKAIQEAEVAAVELPVTVWADEGREVSEFNFAMFEGLLETDLLTRTGFEPLKSEIGDYGVHASQSESIEATDLLPLPIILKRSITAPLKAQVWLVNQSILDYFLVDLRVDKHFVALRRFLFLQDGEFGQALCDQIFDKLSHCLHLQELLSPLTLNQILSRSIQLSASSDSEQADNLSFALKWHPSVFKPNAIDTLDCLELRYHVGWPNNVVITDTCLSKYNKVFSFLLQLKRTGWVLRDIHHQLKISAMIHQASGSPQYHQLQLFRHEMQHFVNVMQGYVVNQVIHVSWEEFQEDLKENVHNLDDLREKHALYLNKAILRCLLNKKAAPVMKIICDILSLVLKVRTQLTSSPWAWDASSAQVIHPCFRNIKKSYMAFKEYSVFLYKVVAKLVTRGYQPHLEEFMLRLDFNDYYQENKT